MKRSCLVMFFAGLLFLLASSASAQLNMGQMYFGVKGGYSKVTNEDIDLSQDKVVPVGVGMDQARVKFDDGWTAGVALGTAFNNIRGELEFEFRQAHFEVSGYKFHEDDSLRTMSVMANIYFDFKTGMAITPFIGTGIGWVRHEIADLDVNDSVIGGHGTAGVSWAFSDRVDVDLAYRYLLTEDPSFSIDNESIDFDYSSHSVTVGVRFKF